MSRRFALASCLAGAALAAIPAHACVPEPMREGESPAEHEARLVQQRDRWEKEREASALRKAASIFIAREATSEIMDEELAKARAAQPDQRSRRHVPPPPPPVLRSPDLSYYRPIAWFRGAGPDAMFPLTVDWTSCGSFRLGDTGSGEDGALYIFFADEGPISAETLFEAIAVNRIADPALFEFAARYRPGNAAPPE